MPTLTTTDREWELMQCESYRLGRFRADRLVLLTLVKPTWAAYKADGQLPADMTPEQARKTWAGIKKKCGITPLADERLDSAVKVTSSALSSSPKKRKASQVDRRLDDFESYTPNGSDF